MSTDAVCRTGKVAFGTKAQAARQAGQMRRTRGKKVDPYQCDWCGFWHLTSKSLAK